MSIKIYKQSNFYYFSKNNLNSNLELIGLVCPFYSKPWVAYRTASQFSVTDYEEDQDKKSEEEKVYGEDLVINAFSNWYNSVRQKSISFDTDERRGIQEEKKNYYKNINETIEQIDGFKEKLKKDYDDRGIEIGKYEKLVFDRLNELKIKFEDLIKKYYNDIKKEEDEQEISDPMTDPMAPMDEDMGGETPDMEMPELDLGAESSVKKKIIKMASKCDDFLSKSEKKEFLCDIGDKVCEYLCRFHPEIIYKICPDNHHISIVDINSGEKILRLYFNDYLILNKIYPLNSLKEFFPINSHQFFERYWKPIVNIVGFYHLEEKNKLIVPQIHKIPDVPYDKNTVVEMGCWDTSKKEYSIMEVSFNENEKSTNWFFKSASINPKNVSKDDLLNENLIVKSIDPKLKSIYGKIGNIIQVIEHADTWYVDVNFLDGELNRVVRLSPEQIEISDGIIDLMD